MYPQLLLIVSASCKKSCTLFTKYILLFKKIVIKINFSIIEFRKLVTGSRDIYSNSFYFIQNEVSVNTETPNLIYIYTQSFIINHKHRKNHFKLICAPTGAQTYTYVEICT